jgi:hypothetical protein
VATPGELTTDPGKLPKPNQPQSSDDRRPQTHLLLSATRRAGCTLKRVTHWAVTPRLSFVPAIPKPGPRPAPPRPPPRPPRPLRPPPRASAGPDRSVPTMLRAACGRFYGVLWIRCVM